jgi:hypothetical protein
LRARLKYLTNNLRKLKKYESYFKNDILPEIQEIEKRKIKARERAYGIYVSMKTFKT